ncbi:MAG: hypothetical protein ABL977_03465 [Candidatus Eisenbacteria bacterium]
MIHRPLIHIYGPSGAGKTTFAEHLIRDRAGMLSAARCVRDDTLEDVHEFKATQLPELRRYREAGAEKALEYRFPSRFAHVEEFYHSSLFDSHSIGFVLEGDLPLESADIGVFVVPPLPPRASLLRRARAVAPRPAGTAPDRWAIAKSYAGVEHARLVILNVRGRAQRPAAERPAAERTAAEVAMLRKDEAVFRDVFGSWGYRTPITTVIADLSAAGDPGLKKALLRVRRVFRDRDLVGPGG